MQITDIIHIGFLGHINRPAICENVHLGNSKFCQTQKGRKEFEQTQSNKVKKIRIKVSLLINKKDFHFHENLASPRN